MNHCYCNGMFDSYTGKLGFNKLLNTSFPMSNVHLVNTWCLLSIVSANSLRVVEFKID